MDEELTVHRDRMLIDLAHTGGVTIEYTDHIPEDRDGEYIHKTRTIRLRAGMHARHHRSVLAHELGHAASGDIPSKFGPVNAKQERRAEEWGALRLITLDAYRSAERLCDGHLGAMAVELGVMPTTAVAYQSMLLRTDQHVYLDPHLGAHQWARRARVA